MIISVDIDTETGIPVGYITIKEAAKRCGVGYMAIVKRIERGKIHYLKIGWEYFIREDSLDTTLRPRKLGPNYISRMSTSDISELSQQLANELSKRNGEENAEIR